MNALADAVRLVHVLLGIVGLAAFWIPVFSRKGGPAHVRYGKVFAWCAYIVLATAGASVAYRVLLAWQEGRGPAEQPEYYALLLFLGYLALVTWIGLRHALAALRTRREPGQMVTPLNRALAVVSLLASFFLIGFALLYRPENAILLYALSPIGIGNGVGILRYLHSSHRQPREWFFEHLGGMLGSGIAFHTAFAVFGVSRIFTLELTGWTQVLPWVLPAAVGIPAILIWARYYRRKFATAQPA